MEPHGHHRLHPGKRADDGPGAASIIQKIVGDVQPCRGQPTGNRVQMLFHGGEHRRQTVGLVGVFRRLREQGGLVLKALPIPQSEAQILPVGRDARPQQNAVDLVLAGGGKGQSRVRRQEDLRFRHAHGLQFLQGVRLPEGDDVYAGVQHAGRQLPVLFPENRTDAAAVHLYLAARLVGSLNVMEIEPQGPTGGDVLNEAAAAVDIQPRVAHGLFPGAHVHPTRRPHPVGQAGGLGVLGENGNRHIRVDGAHLLQNGLQNGVVAGVAPAVSTADHHAVPVPFGTVVAADDLLINMELGVHCALDGELGRCFFIELLAHLPTQSVPVAQRCQIAP